MLEMGELRTLTSWACVVAGMMGSLQDLLERQDVCRCGLPALQIGDEVDVYGLRLGLGAGSGLEGWIVCAVRLGVAGGSAGQPQVQVQQVGSSCVRNRPMMSDAVVLVPRGPCVRGDLVDDLPSGPSVNGHAAIGRRLAVSDRIGMWRMYTARARKLV